MNPCEGDRSAACVEGATSLEADVHKKWTPLLQLLAVDSEVADGTSISLMIVAHVTYRSSLLASSFRHWRQRLVSTLEQQRWQTCLAREWNGRRRLFLFFRAWQWHYLERQHRRSTLQAVEEHCMAARLRRTMKAWKVWMHTARDLKLKVAAMDCEQKRTVMLRHWGQWCRRAVHSIAGRKVSELCEREMRQRWWTVWRCAALRARRCQLLAAALSLHTPSAWITSVPAFPPLCGVSFSQRHGLEVCGVFHDVALRFFWIRWLAKMAHRRGIRLRMYETALHRIEEHRKKQTMADSFHRWLICVVSTRQSRSNTIVTCRRYFRKWVLFVECNTACVRFRMNGAQRMKSFLLRRWQLRTQQCLELKHFISVADAFYRTTLRSRLLHKSLHRWTVEAQSRRAYKALEAAVPDRRKELMRHVAVSRLLADVLLTFRQPSGCDKWTGGSQIPSYAWGPGTSADAPSPPSVSVADRTEESAPPHNPVAALRRRLLFRSAAIPLTVGAPRAPAVAARLVPNATTEAVAESKASGRASQCYDDEKVAPHCTNSHFVQSSPGVVCTSPADHSRSDTRTPDVSLNTSVELLRTDPCRIVEDGKGLLMAYRAMLASAPAERDEMRVICEKIRLYKTQRERSFNLTSGIKQAEARSQQRLFELQQRALDRQALRARLVQLTRQLEASLSSTSSPNRIS